MRRLLYHYYRYRYCYRFAGRRRCAVPVVYHQHHQHIINIINIIMSHHYWLTRQMTNAQMLKKKKAKEKEKKKNTQKTNHTLKLIICVRTLAASAVNARRSS